MKTSQHKQQKVKGQRSDEENTVWRMFRHVVIPLLLIFYSSVIVILLWYTAVHLNGSYSKLIEYLLRNGFFNGFFKIYSSLHILNPVNCTILVSYCVFALILQLFVPGKRVEGPLTPTGNTPVYKDNGFSCYIITLVTFGLLTYFLKQNGMSPTYIYDRFGEFLGLLTVLSFIVCLLLLVKGLTAPSTSDSGSSGNLIFDFYWGTELYPRIAGIDIKVFTNCRFGMTVWPLLVLIFALKSYELHGICLGSMTSTTIQMIYLTKFFWWEAGYMRTIDIMVDRAGYYICWGCLVYIPGFYASVSLYLVKNPSRLGAAASSCFLIIGALSVAINYWADRQKQIFRGTQGRCKIWGKAPSSIRAVYKNENGESKSSLLLTSGWWGVARHFNYVPELTLSLCWTLPSGFNNLLPYTYVIFLLVLLVHRTYRDERKCSLKYKQYWSDYKKQVPYKMIPFIF